MRIITSLIGGLALATSFVVSTADAASADSGSPVTYCETNRTSPTRYTTVIETLDGDSFTANNLRMRTLPFSGRRHLAESHVVAGQPRVMHCMVRSVNGKRAAIITTVGGAEWIVFNPVVK